MYVLWLILSRESWICPIGSTSMFPHALCNCRRARGHLPWTPNTKMLRDWTQIDHRRIRSPTRQQGLYEVLGRERRQEMAGGAGQPQFFLRQRICLRKREPLIWENKDNSDLANLAAYVNLQNWHKPRATFIGFCWIECDQTKLKADVNEDKKILGYW